MESPPPPPPSTNPMTGFAPDDLTDNRQPYDWETRYDKRALKWMRIEAIYLLTIIIIIPLLIGYSATGLPCQWWDPPISKDSYTTFLVFFWAWLGGALGGTVFSLKWLYHSRAKGCWHIDRILWRLFTPHLSAALSISFIALIASGLISIFDNDILTKPLLSFGLSFLTGHFSDMAIAKLAEVAGTLFGPSKKD